MERYAIDKNAALFLVVGGSLGIAVGVLGTLTVVKNSSAAVHAPVAVVTPVEETAVAAPKHERWFVWADSAPANGRSFRSEAECEQYRADRLVAAREEAQTALDEIPPMSINEVQALGYHPAQRIEEAYAQMSRAYCRRMD